MKLRIYKLMASLVCFITILTSGNILVQAQDITVGKGLPTFSVATSWGYPPFVWVDGKGRKVGFDADVLRAIAVVEKFNIGEVLDMDFEGLIPALVAGKYDIFFGGITITKERAKVIAYTNPYWESNLSVLVRKDSGLNIVTALCLGHKAGAHRGTTQHAFLKGLVDAGVDVEPAIYDRPIMALMDLLNGRIDCMVNDVPTTDAYYKEHPDKLKKVGVVYTGQLTGMAVRKGDPNGILPLINDGFNKLHEMGIWDHLVNAYFTGDSKKITAAQTKYRHYLFEELDPLTYAKKLESFMTSKE